MHIDNPSFCAFCKDLSEPLVFRAKERMFGKGDEFEVAECGQCGSIRLIDVPQDLSPYYPQNYYAHQTLVFSSPVKNLLKKLRYQFFIKTGLPIFKPFYGDWFKIIHPPLDSKIADIGCGNGQLLYELYAAGFENLHGFDPFIPGDQTINPHLTLHKKDIFQIHEKFDVIMMHHSFEHMDNPEETLKKAYSLLSKGGCLFIRIPVADAEVWKNDRAFWVQLDAPRHLFIPSVKGLRVLAKSVGFSKEKVIFDSSGFQFWGTEMYKKNIPLIGERETKYFSKHQLSKFNKKAQKLNSLGKGDQACFYFIK